ncbi:uncharacterized protein acin1a isoform X2 [Brachyhypopomus gauderio]|uniref:uncharacterized protein acin1a isoform X2 n=1 Tax=Brachyhypopomus gauderio TaxID=698409 RepID=UPI004042FC2E
MADLEDVTLDGRPLHSLRVADLKAALDERGLSKSGQKNALVKRLKGALMLENLQRTSTHHPGLQPNSQIGEEMSQNSFIKQYLAKQQELLRQRLEREAREAAETADQEDHAETNDGTKRSAPEEDTAPLSADQNKPPASLVSEGLGLPARDGNGLRERDVSAQPSASAPAPASISQGNVGERGPTSSRAPVDSDEESNGGEDDDDDDDEEEWSAAAQQCGRRERPLSLPPRQRSGESRLQQPSPHIPLQLREPTPPPSPPPELSFPLPDTPKQSPPSPGEPPSRQRVSSTSGSGSSSSRSSSPEPSGDFAERRPGPLTLLARKMESEGAFSGKGQHGREDEEDGAVIPSSLTSRGHTEGVVSAITHTANATSLQVCPVSVISKQGAVEPSFDRQRQEQEWALEKGREDRRRTLERLKTLEREDALKREKEERERAVQLEKERILQLEKEEKRRLLEREKLEKEEALKREKALEQERLERERQEREQAIELERQEREKILEQERLERERVLELKRIEKEQALERERQKKEKERLEREKALEQERLEREKALEQERLEREKALEQERLEREKALEQERLEREKALEQERLEREKALELERLEREKALELERLERERALKERLEREKALEQERLEREKALEQERLERERALKERLEREKALELERLEREKALELERLEREKALELERLEREKALEQERLEREKALEQERLEREKALEQERVERERALKERLEREKALEEERLERERAMERERLEREKAIEQERLERERALAQERLEKERALEQEKLEKEKALEQERLEKEKALEQEKLKREKALKEERLERERGLELEREDLKRERRQMIEREGKGQGLEQERPRSLVEEKEEPQEQDMERTTKLRKQNRMKSVQSDWQMEQEKEKLCLKGHSAAEMEGQENQTGVHSEKHCPFNSPTVTKPLSTQSTSKKFRLLRDPARDTSSPSSFSTASVLKRPRAFSDSPDPQYAPPVQAPSKPKEPVLVLASQTSPQLMRQGVLVSASIHVESKTSELDKPTQVKSPSEEKPEAVVPPPSIMHPVAGRGGLEENRTVQKAEQEMSKKGHNAPKTSSHPRSSPEQCEKEQRKEKRGKRSSSTSGSSSDSDSGSSSSSRSSGSSSSQDRTCSTTRGRRSGDTQEETVTQEKETTDQHVSVSDTPVMPQSRRSGFTGKEEHEEVVHSKKPCHSVLDEKVAPPGREEPAEEHPKPDAKSSVLKDAVMAEPEVILGVLEESTTPKALAARRISLSSNKQPPGTGCSEGEGEAASGPAAGAGRKRRWGSSTAVTAKKPSISITTDSLKSLIPDIRAGVSQDTVLDLHPDEPHLSAEEDLEEQGDQDLKIRRTVTQVVPSETQENGQKDARQPEHGRVEEEEDDEAGKDVLCQESKMEVSAAPEPLLPTQDVEVKPAPANETLVRRSISQQKSGVSVTIDDPVRTAKQPSPPRAKPSNIIHICNLVRPFTLGQLKELLHRTGTVVEEGFWIDKIKSHCFVTYSSAEEAQVTRAALHGVKWPQSNPKFLSVDFCQQDELDFHRGLPVGERPLEEERGATAGPRPAAPSLFPERELWAEREREMERRERARAEREWDRDKVRDYGQPGEEGAARRSRSRDRERRRKERGKSEQGKGDKKEKGPEEPPAKLLDDLFCKTKTAPCIYWLPLTEEQAAERQAARAERMREREKRRKELQQREEEEEKKKREEERKQREEERKQRDEERKQREEESRARPVRSSSRGGEGERDRERDRERWRDGDERRDAPRRPRTGGERAGRRSRSRSESPPRDKRH